MGFSYNKEPGPFCLTACITRPQIDTSKKSIVFIIFMGISIVTSLSLHFWLISHILSFFRGYWSSLWMTPLFYAYILVDVFNTMLLQNGLQLNILVNINYSLPPWISNSFWPQPWRWARESGGRCKPHLAAPPTWGGRLGPPGCLSVCLSPWRYISRREIPEFFPTDIHPHQEDLDHIGNLFCGYSFWDQYIYQQHFPGNNIGLVGNLRFGSMLHPDSKWIWKVRCTGHFKVDNYTLTFWIEIAIEVRSIAKH